ncbi:MAG: hypothetical protein IT486_05960 [Gammaproteobacteria bacterium]|nr:hypothetical protein [Gammaproteobacteria bacterium]
MKRLRAILGACSVTLWLVSCGSRVPAAVSEGQSGQSGPAALTPEQQLLAGIELRPLQAAPVSDVVTGQATVLGHDGVAQGVADIRTSEATAAQSAAALRRIEGLRNTPGALGEDALEIARRQAAVDGVQRDLARRRFDAQYGEGARRLIPAQWDALAEGRRKLLRIVMPEGSPLPTRFDPLRFAPLDGRVAHAPWRATAVWRGPSEGGIPGLSLLAVVDGTELAEGSRLLALMERRPAVTGVLVPQSAVVMHDGKLWCFVGAPHGQYTRRAVVTDHPTTAGYVQLEGFAAGEPVVVRGAGLLLAREFGTAEEEP